MPCAPAQESWATLCQAAGTLLGAALLACLVPARRAAMVDPVVALRSD